MSRRWHVLLLVLVACGGSAAARLEPPPPPQSPAGIDRAVFHPQVEAARALAERACACSDPSCFVSVDDDLAAYARTATMNDPLSGVETWPADLDAITNAALARVVACAADSDHPLTAFGTLRLRRQQLLRDAACACVDAPCARRAQDAYMKSLTAMIDAALDKDPALAELKSLADETRRCIDGPLGEQAILDIRAFRTRACACTDAACADLVVAELRTWGERNQLTEMFETSDDELAELGAEMKACLAAARAPVQ